jgi:hypothetical protein
MSWEPFLLNQFLLDCTEAQDKGMEFHYPWLLILISFTAWEEPEDAQFLGLRGKPCIVVKYPKFMVFNKQEETNGKQCPILSLWGNNST